MLYCGESGGIPATRRCGVRMKVLLALLAVTALAIALLSGPAGFGPGQPSAEAALLSEVKKASALGSDPLTLPAEQLLTILHRQLDWR